MSPLLPLAEKGPGVEDTSSIVPDFNIELVLQPFIELKLVHLRLMAEVYSKQFFYP